MIGNLTRDIELKYIPSGAAIAKGAIATSHKYKTQSGEQKEEVCFLDFSVFGKSAEILNQYVRKGSKVMLEGRLIFEQWAAQDGTNRNRHTLRVEVFKFLDSKADAANTMVVDIIMTKCQRKIHIIITKVVDTIIHNLKHNNRIIAHKHNNMVVRLHLLHKTYQK